MSKLTYFKARTLIKRGLVKLVSRGSNFFFFDVKNYTVMIDRKDSKASCTCKAGSCFNVGNKCSHVQACRLLLKSLGKIK